MRTAATTNDAIRPPTVASNRHRLTSPFKCGGDGAQRPGGQRGPLRLTPSIVFPKMEGRQARNVYNRRLDNSANTAVVNTLILAARSVPTRS